jgi:hypothetical protein
MTDLTLSQFKSLSKQELDQLLRQEEFEMLGSQPGHLADPRSRPFSTRLFRSFSSRLRLPVSLQRKFFRNFA